MNSTLQFKKTVIRILGYFWAGKTT